MNAVEIAVDAGADRGEQRHFWRSTGFTPASLLLEPKMRQTIQWIGSIPHRGLRFVRIHFLLDLVRAEGLGSGRPLYDWSRLDEGLDLLLDNGLAPFFELMGNPSGWFTDFDRDGQIVAWRRLVRDLALHLIDRHGVDEVRSWYFEVWNEPDLGWWKHSDAALLRYYDACSEGLAEADAGLRFGGPGTCEMLHPKFKDVLAHCDATGARLDFVSVHDKGGKWSDEAPRAVAILGRTLSAAEWIREHHPRLAEVPLFNDECDPLIGWKQKHTWRGRPYYAAFVARLIDLHQRTLIDEHDVPFAFLSSDNGFLGTWGQRTQLVAFDSATPGNGGFELVKKPVLNLLTALSKLGDRRVGVEIHGGDGAVGVLATRRDDDVCLLIYRNVDRVAASGAAAVSLRVAGLAGDRRLVHHRIDEEHGDPFVHWVGANYPDRPDKDPATALYPDTPDPSLFEALRAHHELARYEDPRDVQVVDGGCDVEFELPMHAVSLVRLLAPRDGGPPVPRRLRAEGYRGCTAAQNVMLRWDDVDDHHLDRYEVEYRPGVGGDWRRIDRGDLLCGAFLHARDFDPDGGTYRVRAVDVWGNASRWSEGREFADPLIR